MNKFFSKRESKTSFLLKKNTKNKELEVCARAIIQDQGKILVCRAKKKNYYFFPGGHIDFGESAKDTLLREMKEELNLSLKNWRLIGTVENIYAEGAQKHHEINLIFSAEVDKINTQSREDHITFSLLDVSEFAQKDVLPIALKKATLKWLKDKKTFWASQIDI